MTIIKKSFEYQGKRLTKEEKLELLEQLYKETQNDKLIALYSEYRGLKSKIKTGFNWVELARIGKKEVRDFLKECYFREDLGMCATDGHRLHIDKTIKKEKEGYYINNEYVYLDMAFPDVSKIIPKRDLEEKELNIDNADIIKNGNFFCYDFGGDLLFQKPYIDEAFSGEKNLTVKFDGEKILFEDDKKLFIIMKMRRD